MKRLLVILMVCVMMLAISATAFGAIHNSWGDFYQIGTYGWNLPSWGGWYYIEAESQYFIGGIQMYDELVSGAILYKNDQTFAEYYREGYEASFEHCQVMYMKGSYQFANNFFVGANHHVNVCDEDYTNILSLGYSFINSERGYIALSADIFSSADDADPDNGTMGYDVDFRFYGEKTRLYGQIYFAPSEIRIHDFIDLGGDDYLVEGTYYQVGLAYQFNEKLVGGIDVYGDPLDFMSLALGLSYYASWGDLNARATTIDDNGADSSTIQALGMYNFTEKLTAGLGIVNSEDVSTFSIAAKYTFAKDKQVRFAYQFGNYNDDVPEILTLTYYCSF